MKKVLDKRKMTAEDWQIYRATQDGLGGSEISTILGINPYKAKFILWLEKTGQKARPQVDNEFIEWGNELEPIIRKKFAQVNGFKTNKCNYVLQHDQYDWMNANIDGEYKDPSRKGKGVLEIKTTAEWNKKEWQGDHVPVAYMAQMQHYLAVTGYEYGAFAVLIGGNKYRQWFVERDENSIELIIEQEKEFMDAVNTKVYPWSIGGSADETEYLASEYPTALDVESTIPPTLEALALEYTEIQDRQKADKERMEEIKNQIRLEAKDIKTLRGNSIKVYMPTISKTLFDNKKFEAEQPELFKQYKTKISTYRDFKVKKLEA